MRLFASELRGAEFSCLGNDIDVMLESDGVFYLNMKMGTGEEYRAVPGDRYPGGKQARQFLWGIAIACATSGRSWASTYGNVSGYTNVSFSKQRQASRCG